MDINNLEAIEAALDKKGAEILEKARQALEHLMPMVQDFNSSDSEHMQTFLLAQVLTGSCEESTRFGSYVVAAALRIRDLEKENHELKRVMASVLNEAVKEQDE
jgi:hypothetical protein